MSRHRTRRRVISPVAMTAFTVAAAGGLVALRVEASHPELVEPGRDPLAAAYLRAVVAGRPDDVAARLRLAREHLARGELADAEAAIAPLLAPRSDASAERAHGRATEHLAHGRATEHFALERAHGRATEHSTLERPHGRPTEHLAHGRAAQDVALEIALAAWRAAPTGATARDDAAERAAARAGLLGGPEATLDELARAAGAARELGRHALAARLMRRAAAIDGARCAAWFERAARDFLAATDAANAAASRVRAFECEPAARARGVAAPEAELAVRARGLAALEAELAADRGADALRLVERLVARFPADRALLERAEALALANRDPRRARGYAARLADLGAAGEPTLRRLFDLDLAAGDLRGAMRTAGRLARLAPHDAGLQRLVARTAEWAGRPRAALAHWRALARRGDGVARDHALREARALEDDAALVELLEHAARRRALAAPERAELAAALDRRGSTDRAIALLERAAHDHDAWEQLVAFHERRRDRSAAIAARIEMTRRRAPDLARSVELARLAWADDRPVDALAELAAWRDVARPALERAASSEAAQTSGQLAWTHDPDELAAQRTETSYRQLLGQLAWEHEPDELAARRTETSYWQLLGQLAWEQESDELAARAYAALWRSGAADALAVERLAILAHESGRHADAIGAAREGWARLREPRLLLVAMDEAVHAARWSELASLREQAALDEELFAGSLQYWLLGAEADVRAGRRASAIRAYRRALLLDGASPAARAGLLWQLVEDGDRAALAAALAAWAADAEDDPRLWRVYAVALQRLGRTAEATAFLRAETEADPTDRAARDRYLAATRVAPPAAPAAKTAVVTAELAVTSLGPLSVRRLGSGARTEGGVVDLDVRAGLVEVHRPARDTVEAPLARDTVELAGGVAVTAFGGRTEVRAGASIQRDSVLPAAAAAHTRSIGRLEARAEAAYHDAAPESAELLAVAVRTRAGGSLALSAGRLYGRATAEARTWSTRAGAPIATGGAGTLELGARFGALAIRAQGGYQRNATAEPPLMEPAVQPMALLPEQLASAGLGAGTTSWRLGPVRLLLDAWLGWIAPPRRLAYRAQSGVTVAAFAGAELTVAGYVANDHWMLGRGELGLQASLAYRFER